MKKSAVALALFTAVLVWQDRAEAIPITCIVCGSTPISTPGVDGTVSFAVVTGANFNAEVAAHAIGFFGAVPQGTLGPIVNPVPTDFVYLYQLVNDGPDQNPISSWSISGGLVGPGGITAGTRLESTLFVDPGIGLVSAGAAGATTGLSGGPTIDFENGLFDPQPVPVPPWGPCLGSGIAGVQCSDGQANLLPTSVLISNWQETPSGILGTPGGVLNYLDPSWSGSVIWFASPFGPGTGSTSILNAAGQIANASVPVPVPEPVTMALFGLGLAGLGFARRRQNA